MTKNINSVFRIVLAILSLCICQLHGEECPRTPLKAQQKNSEAEFLEFLSVVVEKETSFLDHYEKSRENVSLAVKNLKENFNSNEKRKLDVSFQIDALQITKKAQRKLTEFKQFAIAHQNSDNSKIRNISKEIVIFCKYAEVILDQLYKFFLSTDEFLTTERPKKLAEYTALFKEQHDFICELVRIEVEKGKSATQVNPEDVVEFQYSDVELKSMDKWKTKSLDEMMQDAMEGDPAASHMIGLCLLYGHGMPINVEMANTYFAVSASLGFAPAIDHIKAMYLEENPNPFLSLVYVNLVTSFGHPEFSLTYHKIRADWAEKAGYPIVKEIERIAFLKSGKIIEITEKLKKAENKEKAFWEVYLNGGIVGEDLFYGLEYWEKFFNEKNN